MTLSMTKFVVIVLFLTIVHCAHVTKHQAENPDESFYSSTNVDTESKFKKGREIIDDTLKYIHGNDEMNVEKEQGAKLSLEEIERERDEQREKTQKRVSIEDIMNEYRPPSEFEKYLAKREENDGDKENIEDSKREEQKDNTPPIEEEPKIENKEVEKSNSDGNENDPRTENEFKILPNTLFYWVPYDTHAIYRLLPLNVPVIYSQ